MQNANDELRVFRGDDYVIGDGIIIHQPTIGEICDYGDIDYNTMVSLLCYTPQNLKWQLDDCGIDYTKISQWELFYRFLYSVYDQSQTSILFGDLDFKKFTPMQRTSDNAVILYQKDDETGREILIDEYRYILITDYLRECHNIEKDEAMPANERTKKILIEDARDEYEYQKNKPIHSRLRKLISSLTNMDGFKFSQSNVWDMKICAFMDAARRIPHIKNADLLLQSGYSGFGINLKTIRKNELNWFGDLE